MAYTVDYGPLPKALKEVTDKALLRAAQKVADLAKQLCPSPAVAATIRYGVDEEGAWVGSDLDLAFWIEKGTGIYGPYDSPIVPIPPNKVLVFPGKTKSGFVFVTQVDGQKARPFLEPALRAIDQ